MRRHGVALMGLVMAASAACGAAALTVVENGASQYGIVLPPDAIPAEVTAANELQGYLKTVTGAELPIVAYADMNTVTRRIVLGPCDAFREAFPEIDLAKLSRDGIALQTKDGVIYLAGDRPRGTLYAVYTFLEDVVGVRWWSPTEEYTPSKPTLEIPELNTVYKPALEYREAFYRWGLEPVYAARSKCNGHFAPIPEERGGHYTIIGWCHTFYQLLPPETYFAEHPEWYSEIDGKRRYEGAQLCLTNTEMRAELVKKALEWLRQNPNAGIIDISQNDWGGRCQCAACKAVEDEEGAPSGLVVRFVNSVAEELEKEFPDVWVFTLAYQYTRQAPKLARPRSNVFIRLCSIECSFSEPLGTGPANEGFRKDVEDWSAIAPNLTIWDYVTNFASYIQPHPNMRVLAPNIRFFVEHGARGLFEQGDSQCSISDFPELRPWLFAHLMWDPSRDPDALINEFLAGYYGAAAEPLRAYIDTIHDAVEASGVPLRCYMPDTSAWMDLDTIQRATALFDEAQRRAAGDPVLAKRVDRARMPLDHAWIGRHIWLKRNAVAQGVAFSGPADIQAFTNQFIERAKAYAAGSYREGAPFDSYVPRLLAQSRPPAPPPEECKGLADTDWVGIEDIEFRLHNEGNWALAAEDPNSPNGMAARMPASHSQWAVQWPVSQDVASLGPFHCYVSVRCDAKAESGNAMTVGIYDGENRTGVTQRVLTIEETAGTVYRSVDLGVQPLTGNMYFWIAPMSNPEHVENVYIDRMFLIREK